MISSVVVFLGPSLPWDRAVRVLDAEYRPPARQGDIYRVLASDVRRVVLIDGIFHGKPAVWHREILAALDDGIEVLGAASMGALRAAELEPFGMTGHGTIFNWYRQGVIDGDDEVAVHHAPAEQLFRPLSEPLVNLRWTIGRAVRHQLLSVEEARVLIDHAKAMFYPERSYQALLECPPVTGWLSARRVALKRYLRSQRTELKSRDALGLLRLCREQDMPSGHRRRHAPVDPWREEFEPASIVARDIATQRGAVRGENLLRTLAHDPWIVPRVRASVVSDWFLLDWARQRGVSCPPADAARLVRQWEADHGVADPYAWARARRIRAVEYDEFVSRRSMVAWLIERGPESFDLSLDVEADVSLDVAIRSVTAMSPPVAPRSDACRRAFLVAWAAEYNVTVPRRISGRTVWSIDVEVAVTDALVSRGIDAARVRAAIGYRVLADWLVDTGPNRLGHNWNLPVALLREMQTWSALPEPLLAAAGM